MLYLELVVLEVEVVQMVLEVRLEQQVQLIKDLRVQLLQVMEHLVVVVVEQVL